jgi:DNA-binding SARP family transcriptional activator
MVSATVDRILASQVTAPTPSLQLLGGFRFQRGQHVCELPSSVQRVLAYLALQEGPVGRSVVAGELWPDSPEERASANLRTALWRLTRTDPGIVVTMRSELRLDDDVRVDVRETVSNARLLLLDALPDDLVDVNERQFMSELLPYWFEDWVLFERERLRQLCMHALEALAVRLLAERSYGRAIEAALAAVRGEPLRESAHRTLVQIHLAEGNFQEALRQYERYRELVRDELGREPTPAFTALLRDVGTTAG